MAKALIVNSGDIYHFVTVLKEVERNNKQRSFQCKCVCGKVFITRLVLLTNGQTKSCGCKRVERFIEMNTFHGMSRSKLNAVWQSMKQRCLNPNHKYFSHYGGRGIEICKEWLTNTNFFSWALSNGYKEGLTIDRINVNGNYEPLNCQWVTMKSQCRNKRDNVFIEFNNKTLCIADWAKKIGISYSAMRKRLQKWSVEKALTTPKSMINDTTSNIYREPR